MQAAGVCVQQLGTWHLDFLLSSSYAPAKTTTPQPSRKVNKLTATGSGEVEEQGSWSSNSVLGRMQKKISVSGILLSHYRSEI